MHLWQLQKYKAVAGAYGVRIEAMPELVDEVVRNSQTLSACLGIIQDFIISSVKLPDEAAKILKETVNHVVRYSSIVLVLEIDEQDGITVSAGNIGSLVIHTRKDKLGRLKITHGSYNGYKVGVLNEHSDVDIADSAFDTYVIYKAMEYNADLYPVLAYEPIILDAVNEFSVKKQLYSEIENAFSPKAVIFKPKDVVEDETSDALLSDAMRSMLGSTGDTLVLIEYERGGDKPEITVLDKKVLGSEYLAIKQAAEENIKRFFHIPEVLFGTAIAGKLGQNNEFDGAMEYMEKYVAKTYIHLINEAFVEVYKAIKEYNELNKNEDAIN